MDGTPLAHRGFVARAVSASLFACYVAVACVPELRLVPEVPWASLAIIHVLASTVAGLTGLLIIYRRKWLDDKLRGPVRISYLLIPMGLGYKYMFCAFLAHPLPRRGRGKGLCLV